VRLELGTFPVNEIAFGSSTRWDKGVLEISKKELLAAVRKDTRVTGVELELVRPGESVRITSVRDVIEPRIKVKGPGMVYPGVCDRPVVTVGSGRTHRLAGVGVVEVAEVEMYKGNDGWLDGFIDMSGPGADNPFGSMPNLCLVVKVDPRLSIEDQNDAIHKAALMVSDRLAGTTVDKTPPEMETFELKEAPASLPRVAYICCHRSPQHYSASLSAFWTSIYGLSRLTPPWVLHPNELLDGAVSIRTSWSLVNNPMVYELCRRHGKDLAFAGVIVLRTRWSSQSEKDITSLQAAKVAQMLGATGAIITYDAGGNDFMEVIRTVQACENVGIKTVFVTGEEPQDTGGPPLLEPLPEARAIVSVGVGHSASDPGLMPAVKRVIGQRTIVADPSQRQHVVPSNGPLSGPRWIDHYGWGKLSCFDF